MEAVKLGAPGAPASEAAPAKIRDASRQFEALLVSQLLRCGRGEDGGWLGGGGDAAGGIASEYAEQQFAEAIAARGGLGLADLIARGLERAG